MNTETNIRYEAFQTLEDGGTQTIDSDIDLQVLIDRNLGCIKDGSITIDKWDGDTILEDFDFKVEILLNEKHYIVLGEKSVFYIENFGEKTILKKSTDILPLDFEVDFFVWEYSIGLNRLLSELSGWTDFREVSKEIAIALGYKEN